MKALSRDELAMVNVAISKLGGVRVLLGPMVDQYPLAAHASRCIVTALTSLTLLTYEPKAETAANVKLFKPD